MTHPTDNYPTNDAAGPAMHPEPPPSSPPPVGPGVRALFLPLLVAVVALFVGVQWGGAIKARAADLWHVVFGEAQEEGDGRYYTCGMHPWVILPKPGDCPICHMKLEPIDPAKFTGAVVIDPVVTQNIGVRLSPVEAKPVAMTIRTVGAVAYDETRVRDVNTKVAGWIERLHVDWLGAPVKVGQPLADLYSPELFAAQGELLSASRGGAGPLAEAARTRLRYMDVTAAQVAELEEHGAPSKTVTLMSPHEGLVVEKHANEGMAFTPGMQLYRIADLSVVWVMVTLYEYQLPYVQVGSRATMTLPYLEGPEREGRVAYVYPTVNTRTREVQVRLEFDNADLSLKPGMFASVRLGSTLPGDRVVVPRAAVIDTGVRKVAFVSLGDGRFEPREVETGVETDQGVLEITKGLEAGEMVVTSGQFLLDSEAKTREALARMMKGELASEQEPVAPVAGASELSELPPEGAKALGAVLDATLAIGEALASDTTEGVAAQARRLGEQAAALAETELPAAPHFWHRHREIEDVRRLAGELAKGPGIADARGRLAELSTALGTVLRATGVPPDYSREIHELHCPMYNEGATWLQAPGSARNPYFGAKMLTCSDARIVLPVTGAERKDGAAGEGAAAEEGGHSGHGGHGGHGGEAPAEVGGGPAGHGGHGEAPASLPPALQAASDKGFAAYLKLADTLAGDDTAGLRAALADLQAMAAALSAADDARLRSLGQRLGRAAIAPSAKIDAVRGGFKELSDTMIALADVAPPGPAVAPALRVARCPMVKAEWLQTGEKVRNPYYGSQMLTCGSILRTIRTGPGAAPGAPAAPAAGGDAP